MITVIGMGCKTGDVTVDGIEAIKKRRRRFRKVG